MKYVIAFTIFFQVQVVLAALKIGIVSVEKTGVLQTGGLAHATNDLAEAMAKYGHEVEVLMPGYLSSQGAGTVSDRIITVDLDWHDGRSYRKSEFSLRHQTKKDVEIVFFDDRDAPYRPNYFADQKGSYGEPAQIGEAFGALNKAQASFILSQNYDVVILNDWSAGLVAYHLRQLEKAGAKIPKIIFAIHNIAYQGNFDFSLARFLGLPQQDFSVYGYELYGKMSFLKAGLFYADHVYTVSPQYARELTTPRFGAGLDGLIQTITSEGRMSGILNGINVSHWDPTTQTEQLPWAFDSSNFSGKFAGKGALQKTFGLQEDLRAPLFVLTSRLDFQKGFEYLIPAMRKSLETTSSQWFVIGDGNAAFADALKQMQQDFPGRMIYSEYNSDLEKKLIRYGDFFVNAAWFEPSGLNQMFALRNGTVPLVSRVGGLVDSVFDNVNGITFEIPAGPMGMTFDKEIAETNLVNAVQRAIDLYADSNRLDRIRKAGMAEDHSWVSRVKNHYNPMFIKVLEGTGAEHRVLNCGELLSAS